MSLLFENKFIIYNVSILRMAYSNWSSPDEVEYQRVGRRDPAEIRGTVHATGVARSFFII